MLTQMIQCDLLNNKPSENIIFRQGETGRVINFEILKDGVPVDLSAYNVAFSLYKPDGNFVIAECVVDDDTASVTETEQMTAVCGVGYFDLKISDNDEIIYTYNGLVLIDTPVITTEVINSLSDVFGLTFPDDFQEKLTAGENITIVDNVISATGGGGGEYTAGNYIDIVNNVIDVKTALINTINGKASQSDLTTLAGVVAGKQDALTAGDYISILNNVIDVKTELINTINGKASQSDLTTLSGVVSGKQDALTAGDYIDIVNNVIDVKTALINTINGKASQSDLTTLAGVVADKANQSDLTTLSGVVSGKQDALTAGSGINITNNVISATGGGGGGIDFDNPDITLSYDNFGLDSNYTHAITFTTTEIPVGKYFCILDYHGVTASTFNSVINIYFNNSNVDRYSALARTYLVSRAFPNVPSSLITQTQAQVQGYIERKNTDTFTLYVNGIQSVSSGLYLKLYLYRID